jgi:hypothetical protein
MNEVLKKSLLILNGALLALGNCGGLLSSGYSFLNGGKRQECLDIKLSANCWLAICPISSHCFIHVSPKQGGCYDQALLCKP